MRLPWKHGVIALAMLLTGCSHKSKPVPVPAIAPASQTSSTDIHPADAPEVPSPIAEKQEQPHIDNVPAQPKGEESAETPKPPVHHKKPPVAPAKPSGGTTQQASNGASVSAIGQLTSGGGADQKTQLANSINWIERSLNSISRPLSGNEQKTTGQIREYLKQARAALGSSDYDGTRTLTAKARLLLNELTR